MYNNQSNETGDPIIMNVTGLFLDDAVNWFKENDIPLYGINENPTQKNWTNSQKAYGHLYIDDCALGCPMNYPHLKGSGISGNSHDVTFLLQRQNFNQGFPQSRGLISTGFKFRSSYGI